VPDSFEDLISQVFATLSGTAKQNNTRFMISLAADLMPGGQNQEQGVQFIFDKARLCQVLVNLVGNSIKFSPDGLVTLCITAIHRNIQTGTRSGAAEVSFEVNDTGIGMTASQINRLFDPFVQVHDGKNQAFGGTGLGLTIAKQLVEKMGGELHIASRQNVGSSFNFSIVVPVTGQPAAPSNTGRNEGGSAKFIEHTSAKSKSLKINTKQTDRTATLLAQSAKIIGLQLDTSRLVSRPKRDSLHREAAETATKSALPHQTHVLVAEDQEVNKIYIQAHLKKLGCRVTLTANGREAIAASKVDRFDLILLDCQMPEVDGLQAAAEISLHQKNVPIYAVTACPDWNERVHCLASGMVDVLTKPISESALAANAFRGDSNAAS
jgi:CheY-like chemotaxis protein